MIFSALTSSVSLFPVRDSSPSMNMGKVKAQAGGHKEVSPGLMYSSASEEPSSFCRFFCFRWGLADVWDVCLAPLYVPKARAGRVCWPPVGIFILMN